MPILKHAKKKLRQDKNRTLKNKKVRALYKSLIKKAKKEPTKENMSAAFKQIDKAAKNNIIHDNKAARLKSALSKVSGSESKGTNESQESKGTKASQAKKPALKKTAKTGEKKPTTKKTPSKK